MADTQEQTEPKNRAPVWTVRKLRAVILIVMIAVVALFFGLRGPGNGESEVPDGPAAGVDQQGQVDAGSGPGGGPTERTPRQARSLDPSQAVDATGALEAADAALAEGRLYDPPGDSAIEHYRRVLELEPDNEAAREGLETVGAMLVQRMDRHLAERDLVAAEEVASVLAGVFESLPEAEALVERLDQLALADRAMVSAQQQLEEGNLVNEAGNAALGNLSRVRELDPEHPDLEEAIERLEFDVVERALTMARSDRFQEALFLIRRALRFDERSSFLVDTERRIERFQAQRIREVAEDSRAAMRAARFDKARELIDAAEALGASSGLVQALSSELRHALVYGVFAPGETFSDAFPDGSPGPEMIVLPAGAFLMGTLPSTPGHTSFEEPRHRVEFSRGFALATTEVTVSDFRRFVEATGYVSDAEREGASFVYNESNGRVIRRNEINWRHNFRGRAAADDTPVIHVSWNDATAYARWLASETGMPYRLPTEAEYEYAHGAGSAEIYWWGAGSPPEPLENLTGDNDRSPRYDRAWNQAFTDYADGFWGPAPVASLSPNPYGLYDMAGNVQEWVADCWHDSYVRAPADGSAWINQGCERRVARGSFWGGAPETARIAYRTGYLAGQRGAALGFRVARDLYRTAQ